MSIIITIVVGFIVGLIARAIMPGNQSMGLIMTTILGIVGSLVALALGALGFGLVFLGLAALLRIHQVTDAVRGGVRRLRRS